jgi:hypothetical protein
LSVARDDPRHGAIVRCLRALNFFAAIDPDVPISACATFLVNGFGQCDDAEFEKRITWFFDQLRECRKHELLEDAKQAAREGRMQ